MCALAIAWCADMSRVFVSHPLMRRFVVCVCWPSLGVQVCHVCVLAIPWCVGVSRVCVLAIPWCVGVVCVR